MVERREVRLDDDDLVAAAQILSWIALPHRPQHGVTLLNHWYWARKRHRGEPLPELPFVVRKKNRIENQLAVFERHIMHSIRGAIWLEYKILSGPKDGRYFEKLLFSTRKMAWQDIKADGDIENLGNHIRDIWSKRRPVLHLALSSFRELAKRLPENWGGGFNLEQAVFEPSWVSEAIRRSESLAGAAWRAGEIPEEVFIYFYRDSF